MTIRADRDAKFYFRFLLIGLVAMGFALWSLYDGYVAYPRQREHALAYAEHYEKEGSKEAWDEIALERDWPTDYPGEPKSEADILMQYVMVASAGLVGLMALLFVLQSRGQWIESSGTGVTSSWGATFDFDQVVSLDKKSWRRKGIAKVTYQDGGRKRRFVIDDYKFLREPTDKILCLLESKIDPELIVGGPPEAADGSDGAAGDVSN
jgi:hypothetical protein